jgi:hypothetical protein
MLDIHRGQCTIADLKKECHSLLNMSEHEPNEQYHHQADQLEAIFLAEAGDREYSHVHWIIKDLRNGDFHKAQVNYRNQSDKYDWLPKTKKFLQDIGVAE